MAIQGIRAFSPNKECTIEFYKPLTMIVGANGCGKTTIIECLKYATTGLSPPGGDKGRFVHDPKIAGMPEVKASIKLRFTNRAGQDMVVIRSLQLTQKKTQATFKTLDGVIKQTNPTTGEKSAMSHKCGELDKLIPNLMGVSRAIMENVIFCHQEESSWPLGDPASLKKKFDDIFESSRYSKALETIRKTKLEFSNKTKEMKVELASLDAYREQAEVITTDLEKLNKTMDRYEGREGKFNSDLADLATEIEVHRSNERKAKDKLLMVETAQRACNERKAVLAEKESNLGEAALRDLLSGQGEEGEEEEEEGGREAAIKKNIEELEEEVSHKTADADAMASKLASVEKRQLNASNEWSAMLDAQGQLKADLAREQEDAKELSKLGTAIGRQYGLGSFPAAPEGGDFGEASFVHKVGAFATSLRDTEVAAQTNLMAAESTFDDQVKELNGESLAYQKELAEMSGRLAHQEDTHVRVDAEFEAVSVEITSMGRVRSTTRVLEDAKKRKDDLSAQIDQLKNLPRNGEMNLQIRDCDRQIKELGGDISEYRDAEQGMEQRGAEEDKLQLAEDQADECLDELQQKVDAKRKVFQELEGGKLDTPLSDGNLRMHRTDLIARRQAAQEGEATAMRKHTDAERLLLQKETTLDGLRQHLEQARQEHAAKDPPGAQSVRAQAAALLSQANELKQELEREEDNEETVGGAQASGVELTGLQELEEWAEETQAACLGRAEECSANANLFKMLLKKAAKKQVCGCCMHKMSDVEYASFQERLQPSTQDEVIVSERENAQKLKQMASRCRELKFGCAAAEEASAKVGGLENDLSDLGGEIGRLAAAVPVCAEELKSASGVRKGLEEVEAEVGKVFTEFTELSRRKAEAAERKERLQSQMDPLSASQHLPRSLALLKTELRQKEGQRDELSEKVRTLNAEKMAAMSRLQSTESSYRLMYEDYDKLEAASNKLRDLEERKSSLRTQADALLSSKAQLKQEMGPKRGEVADKQALTDRVTAKWKQDEARLRGEHGACVKAVADLERLNNQVASAVKKGTSQRLHEKLEGSNEQQSKIERYASKAEEYKAAIAMATQQGSTKTSELKQAKDNLSLLLVRREVATMEEELQRLKQVVQQSAAAAALGSQGQALRSWEQCEQDKSQVEQDRAENRGKMATLERQTHELKLRLKEPNYRGVKDRTRMKRVELETTNMAVEDLEKYWGALDKALLRFHGQKISDINRIIRELWQRTYCGQDIDGIEIVSGEEGGSTRAARSYNYRVVMRKGDTSLDMRGRCSAGQRVLACIVIRLALAETFCLSCGILTLDEPTTNLDEYNKTGLANALAEIISVRAKQRNFQLVVITHDADFVTHMRDAFNSLGADRSFNLPEFYWRISRNQTGHNGQYCSEIHRTDWDDM